MVLLMVTMLVLRCMMRVKIKFLTLFQHLLVVENLEIYLQLYLSLILMMVLSLYLDVLIQMHVTMNQMLQMMMVPVNTPKRILTVMVIV